MTDDLNEFIRKYLRPPENWPFEVEPIDEIVDFDYETTSGPQFMPRVVPPEHEQASRRRHPSMQAGDGGPGVKDHSIIKRLLREWL